MQCFSGLPLVFTSACPGVYCFNHTRACIMDMNHVQLIAITDNIKVTQQGVPVAGFYKDGNEGRCINKNTQKIHLHTYTHTKETAAICFGSFLQPSSGSIDI